MHDAVLRIGQNDIGAHRHAICLQALLKQQCLAL